MQPNRHSQRKKDYDYCQPGYYHVTLCTQNRSYLFGVIVEGDMLLNDAGLMINKTWNDIPDHYPGLELDEMQIMPNHLHGIIVINDRPGLHTNPHHLPGNGRAQGPAGGHGEPPLRAVLSLSDVVERFKSLTTTRYIEGVRSCKWPPFPGKLWQRNFHDRIIRNEIELNRVRTYINNNPSQWGSDENNVD